MMAVRSSCVLDSSQEFAGKLLAAARFIAYRKNDIISDTCSDPMRD
jgi:hypothetical protein